MSNANRLRDLANKCDEVAAAATTEEVRKRQTDMAAAYRRMAVREDWMDQQSFPLPEGDKLSA